MSRKNYFTFLTVAALFLASSLAVFGQAAPVRGKVELLKADGTKAPLAGAVVDVYRTDSKGKAPSAKTDKKGNFGFAGLLIGQTFAFAISAPNAESQVFPNIKPGQDGLTFTLHEGDGKALTEEEVRQALTAPKTAQGNTQTQGKAQPQAESKPATAEEIAAAKKAQAEYEKQVAEVTAKNKKVENINQVVDKALKEGRAAFDAKNYDLAIVKYTEGVDADPEFAGTAPVFLNNKGTALRQRGFESYKKSSTDTANKQSLMESAKKDFQEAISAFQRSLAVLKTATATDAKLQKDYEANRKAALAGMVETYRLMVGSRADQTQGKEAVVVATDYVAAEADPAQKTKTLVSLADTLRLAGDSSNAVPVYRMALTSAPENPDILAGMGLSLFSAGAEKTPADKALMQEGLNMMTRFAEIAPETHPLKADVKGAVEYLKTTEKLTPQKTARPAASKKKT